MSSLFAVCPAPFQKPKKKGIKKNGSRKPHGVSAETPLPTILDRFVGSSSEQPARRQHEDHRQPTVTKISSSEQTYQYHQCNCCESSEYGATCGSVDSSHTSGYQTDDGTFEGKMLKRASRTRPANLRMTAIRDYTPCCNEELAVRRGQRVKVLYKNNDWVYAVTKSGEAGYIPYSFVRPSRKYAGYQSEPEYCQGGGGNAYQSGYDTDMPVSAGRSGAGRRYGHGSKAQIGDVMPAYSVHTGFRGNVSPEVRIIQSNHSPVEHQKHSYMSGYTSAVEYPAGTGMEQRSSRHHPRSAKSMHTLVETRSPREHRPSERKPEINSFDRSYLEELVVIHDFEAKEEDEVFIAKGEVVKVFNADDPFWLWIETTPGDQGFVPRSCCSLGNHPLLQSNAAARGRIMSSSSSRLPPSGPATGSRHARRYYHHQDRSRVQSVARQARSQAKQRFHELARLRKDPQNPVLMEKEDIQKIGSKLIVLMDYTATQDDELNIQFAETVFADVLRQGGADRIWAYCPRTDQCGFVPVSLVIPPVV